MSEPFQGINALPFWGSFAGGPIASLFFDSHFKPRTRVSLCTRQAITQLGSAEVCAAMDWFGRSDFLMSSRAEVMDFSHFLGLDMLDHFSGLAKKLDYFFETLRSGSEFYVARLNWPF